MNAPGDVRILYPIFGMFLIVCAVFGRMAAVRFQAVSSGRMNPAFYRLYQGDEEPEDMRKVTRHFLNLFEMPVLFYVVAILTYVTGQASGWMLGWAWAYVALRALHAWVHLGSNDVLTRFRVFLLSNVALMTLWASLFVKLLGRTGS